MQPSNHTNHRGLHEITVQQRIKSSRWDSAYVCGVSLVWVFVVVIVVGFFFLRDVLI